MQVGLQSYSVLITYRLSIVINMIFVNNIYYNIRNGHLKTTLILLSVTRLLTMDKNVTRVQALTSSNISSVSLHSCSLYFGVWALLAELHITVNAANEPTSSNTMAEPAVSANCFRTL